ncbi:MAG: hypothetical protein V3569_03030 [Acholeplasmataceae bacterium]|nr:hypothetical protein [Acholeplasmataceae bacterium]
MNLPSYVYSIILFAFLIFIFLMFMMIFVRKKRFTEPKKPFNPEVALKLYQALGGSNIKSLSLEHQRLKVTVGSLKQIHREKLKETQFPAAVKGKEITLFVRYYPEDMYRYLEEKTKEI